jgi:hypothetical protein
MHRAGNSFHVAPLITPLLVLLALPAPALAASGVPNGIVSFFMSDSCPEGWRPSERAQGRLILATVEPSRVGKTYGTPLGPQQMPEHVHDFKGQVTLSSEPLAAASGGGNPSSGPQGTHEATGVTAPTTSNLPFQQLIACEKAEDEKEVVDSMPYQAVSFFQTGSCPNGWALFREANGRFLVPWMQGGTLGAQVVSQAWLDGPSNHTHSLESSVTLPSVSFIAAKHFITTNNSLARAGQYTLTGQSSEARAEGGGAWTPMPYVELLACTKTRFNKPRKPIPSGMVVFSGADNCADGWKVTLTTSGRFLVGLPSGGEPGAAFGGEPLRPQEDRQHSHSMSGTFTLSQHNVAVGTGCCANDYAQSGSFTYHGSAKPSSMGVPYVVVRQCTKE